jgi:hypothetical protein
VQTSSVATIFTTEEWTNVHASSWIRIHDPSVGAVKTHALDRTTAVVGTDTVPNEIFMTALFQAKFSQSETCCQKERQGILIMRLFYTLSVQGSYKGNGSLSPTCLLSPLKAEQYNYGRIFTTCFNNQHLCFLHRMYMRFHFSQNEQRLFP